MIYHQRGLAAPVTLLLPLAISANIDIAPAYIGVSVTARSAGLIADRANVINNSCSTLIFAYKSTLSMISLSHHLTQLPAFDPYNSASIDLARYDARRLPPARRVTCLSSRRLPQYYAPPNISCQR